MNQAHAICVSFQAYGNCSVYSNLDQSLLHQWQVFRSPTAFFSKRNVLTELLANLSESSNGNSAIVATFASICGGVAYSVRLVHGVFSMASTLGKEVPK